MRIDKETIKRTTAPEDRTFTSILTRRGQITIPKDIRRRLNLRPGDRIEFVIDEAGCVLVLPASIDALELAGILKFPARTVSVEDMNRAIRKRDSSPVRAN